jgi:uncharacterized membrane protein YdfJ with MMPL/SSD domain
MNYACANCPTAACQENSSENVLVLRSPRGNESYSHRVANHVIDEIRADHPIVEVAIRDLANDPLPRVAGPFVSGRGLPAEQRNAAQASAPRVSDALVDEVDAADISISTSSASRLAMGEGAMRSGACRDSRSQPRARHRDGSLAGCGAGRGMRPDSLRNFASGSLIGAAIVCLALAVDAPDDQSTAIVAALAIVLACAVALHAAPIRSLFASSARRSASAIIAPRQSMKSPDKGCAEVSQRACSSVG